MDADRVTTLLNESLFSFSTAQIERVKREARSFVHYTTTEAALSIINKREIWLRNSVVMNDYSEMAHGEACVRFALIEDGETSARSRRILDSVLPGLHDRTVHWFYESSAMRRNFTYLLSISEHGPLHVGPGVVDEESEFGRLSMWRAYGARGGVALIFRQEALMAPNDALAVYSSPVFYGKPPRFSFYYNSVLSYIDSHLNEIKQIDPALFEQNVQRFIHFAALSCKHPGFSEEREWRITYSASPAYEHFDDEAFNAVSRIKREFVTVNGVPQRIYKIPFRDDLENGISGITLPDLLSGIVIGPTQFPVVVYDALHIALGRAGVGEGRAHMAISEIPLRT